MSNWLKLKFNNWQISFASKIAYRTQYEISHWLLSTIGLDDLEKIVEAGKKNRTMVGHTDYSNLAEIYIEIMKGRAKGTFERELSELWAIELAKKKSRE